MNRTGKILAGIAVVLVLAAVFAGTMITTRSVPFWKTTDDAVIMKEGRLYGLRVLLESYGHDNVEAVRYLNGFGEAAGSGQLMVVAAERLESREDAQELLSWVAAGNHIVLPVYGYGSGEDGFEQVLFDSLKVKMVEGRSLSDSKDPKAPAVPLLPQCRQVQEMREEAAAKVGEKVEHSELWLRMCSFTLSRITLPEGGDVYVAGRANWGFEPQPGSSVLFKGQSLAGVQIIRLRYGEGTVVLNGGGLEWLDNPEQPDEATSGLMLHDHAYLAAYLAQEKEKILLVRFLRSDLPPLKTPLWWQMIQAQPILAALLLLTAAALLWRIVARVGIIRLLPPAPERYLKQHLLAQGQFLGRHLSRRAILSDLQRSLLEQLQRRHPGWQKLTPQKRLDLLCSQTRLPPTVVEPWLTPLPETVSRTQWLAMLRGHQRITRKIRSTAY